MQRFGASYYPDARYPDEHRSLRQHSGQRQRPMHAYSAERPSEQSHSMQHGRPEQDFARRVSTGYRQTDQHFPTRQRHEHSHHDPMRCASTGQGPDITKKPSSFNTFSGMRVSQCHVSMLIYEFRTNACISSSSTGGGTSGIWCRSSRPSPRNRLLRPLSRRYVCHTQALQYWGYANSCSTILTARVMSRGGMMQPGSRSAASLEKFRRRVKRVWLNRAHRLRRRMRMT